MNMNLEPVTLVGGQKILGHRRCDCESQEHCCVHKPSDHHMVTWTQNWRQDTGVMERICPCGVGHPDPDHIAYVRSKLGDKVADTQLVHGCCGCCSQAPKTPRKTPRKSMAEIRAEERSRGFEEAMRFFEEAWRDRVWNVARGKMGHDPTSDFLWTIIEKANKRMGELDDAYKSLMFPRVYDEEYPIRDRDQE